MGASECVSSMAFFSGFHSSSEDRAIRLLLIAEKEKCRKERYEKSERRKERGMMRGKKKTVWRVLLLLGMLFLSGMTVFAAGENTEYVPDLYATVWSLVPPVVAIVLALITKEVYSSLFIGILIGGVFYSGFQFEGTILHVFQDGIVGSLTDSYNMGILVFLVVLGIMVCMMNKAGGSAAFGRWASTHIKSRVGAQLATILLGVLIFIDDYFNCLTVGSVMRPVTDKHNVSRAKLAYLIDATAAPVCIIAPISSWAAAVTGFVEGEDGFSIFIRAIPFNYYALLTIVMMVAIVLMKMDYGSMRQHEMNAIRGDLYTTPDRPYADAEDEIDETKGSVIDLLFPVIALIICCVIGMRMPNVPHDVPVANARKQATRKISAGIRLSIPPVA